VKDLFIPEELALRVPPALEEVVKAERRVGGLLPALQNMFFEGLQPSNYGPFREAFRQLVVVRCRTGQPIVVLCWETREGSIHAK